METRWPRVCGGEEADQEVGDASLSLSLSLLLTDPLARQTTTNIHKYMNNEYKRLGCTNTGTMNINN